MIDARIIFPENLKIALDKRGVSQGDLAIAVGVSPATVSYWCKGKKYPRPGKMQMIAEALHVSISWLTTGELSSYERYAIESIVETDSIIEISKQYAALDEDGKNAVKAILNVEMERMRKQK